MTTQTCQPTQSRACLCRQHASLYETVFWKILHVFRPLCPLACVFTGAWLHIPDISFFAIHMGPSSVTFSTRFVVSAYVRMFPCLLAPAWIHLPDISIFAIATHSFSHICTLSDTHFCSCFHCHYYKVPFAIGNLGQRRVPQLVSNKRGRFFIYSYISLTEWVLLF